MYLSSRMSQKDGLLPRFEDERRFAFQLFSHWSDCCGGRDMPLKSDMDPNHPLLAEAWASCFIVQVQDIEKESFKYSHVGAELVQACEKEWNTDERNELASVNVTKLLPLYLRVAESRYPLITEGRFTNRQGGMVKFRQAMFPYGEHEVEEILGHIGYTMEPSSGRDAFYR